MSKLLDFPAPLKKATFQDLIKRSENAMKNCDVNEMQKMMAEFKARLEKESMYLYEQISEIRSKLENEE